MFRRHFFIVALFAVGFASAARAQLVFTFSHDPGMNASAVTGFQAAAARWSAVLFDPITIKLDIGFDPLDAGTVASASSTLAIVTYPTFTAALTADRVSANDYSAVAALPSGSSFNILLNRTAESSSATPYSGYSDALVISIANARALGLYQASGGLSDASITFSSALTFDFDPSDGIAPGAIDFVGAATHEIGHALGFQSGVDYLDQNPGLAEANTYQTPFDMFRYSSSSVALGLIDSTADTREKFFSLNGGTTSLATLSTGVTFGDGSQAGHWKDDLGLGIMDPTAMNGELLQIKSLDLVAFDAIGYNLTSIPEPADIALWVALAAGSIVMLRRRQRSAGAKT